jgi:hypothetical protein
MITWATIVALAMGALVYVSDSSSILLDLAELGAVIALFMLVCAAEAFSVPQGRALTGVGEGEPGPSP